MNTFNRPHTRQAAALIGLLVLAVPIVLVAQAQQNTERQSVLQTHSRAPFHHRIALFDENGKQINPRQANPPPYSPRATCGKCHAYEEIEHGWHFNAALKDVEHGRAGEPWIVTDYDTRTQLPVTSRPWHGAFTPEQLGMTAWEFTEKFGARSPGGGVSEAGAKDESDPEARWKLSGALEIDCMLCHSAGNDYDFSEWTHAVENQNYRWAATAGGGLARIHGNTKTLPKDYDFAKAAEEASAAAEGKAAQIKGPHTLYDQSRFDADDKVFFDIVRSPGPERCYTCHSFQRVEPDTSAIATRWHTDMDIHMVRGMTCADCHRHGMDHKLARGYENEPLGRNNPAVATLSCQGCHMGDVDPTGKDKSFVKSDDAGAFTAASLGRLTAPHPQHTGIPPIHFEKLTCTACHSGEWPGDAVGYDQTSMAHHLGYATVKRTGSVPPLIQSPVFLKNDDGKIAPHRMIWPSYWASMKDNSLVPLDPKDVYKAARKALRERKPADYESIDFPPLTPEKIGEVIDALAGSEIGKDEKHAGAAFVYVNGGRLYSKADDGKVTGVEHKAAEPYTWAIAHDVRPAAQSLGVRGCTDCHQDGAPIDSSLVTARSPGQVEAGKTVAMYQLRGGDGKLIEVWNWSFSMRPLFKVAALAGVAIVALVLLYQLMTALAGLGKKA